MKKLPQRTCIACNEKKDKKDLIRIVKNNQNEIFLDETGKANGRGAYICNNVECFDKLVKSKKLEKTFEMQIEEQIYENLRGVIVDKD